MTSDWSAFVCLCGPDLTSLVDTKTLFQCTKLGTHTTELQSRAKGSAPRYAESLTGSRGGGGPGAPPAPCAELPGGAPDAVEHGLVLGGRLGDGPFGAHHLHGVLLLPAFAVLALVELGFRHSVLPQDLRVPGGKEGSSGSPEGAPEAQQQRGKQGWAGGWVPG